MRLRRARLNTHEFGCASHGASSHYAGGEHFLLPAGSPSGYGAPKVALTSCVPPGRGQPFIAALDREVQG